MTKNLLKFLQKHSSFFYILLIIVISTYPRIWQLTNHPPLIVDEPANLRDIATILDKGLRVTDFHWDFSKSYLGYIPTVLLIKATNIQNHLFALRLSSVVVSLLGLIPFFFIVKNYSNEKIAFSTTLLYSNSYYYLQFSRVGWVNIILVNTLGLFLVYLLQTGVNKKNLKRIAASGILAGLIFYSYRSGIIYILASFMFLLTENIKKRISLKKMSITLFVFVFSFLVTTLPWIIKIVRYPEKYNLRLRAVSIKKVNKPYHGLINNKDIFKYQIETSLKSWVLMKASWGEGSENPRYLPSRYPPVNFLIKITYWIGLIIAILNIRKYYLWLIIMTAGIVSGQILTVNPPNGARGLIMLPAIYILSALAINQIYKRSGKKNIVLTATIIVSLMVSLYDLFFYQYWMTWIQV